MKTKVEDALSKVTKTHRDQLLNEARCRYAMHEIIKNWSLDRNPVTDEHPFLHTIQTIKIATKERFKQTISLFEIKVQLNAMEIVSMQLQLEQQELHLPTHHWSVLKIEDDSFENELENGNKKNCQSDEEFNPNSENSNKHIKDKNLNIKSNSREINRFF
ncbi:hypothetical protein BpHYR1_035966 [Brachionus plicatilis]|uniref:Uncharacterized protein n=1 Tax=Brachionus plicatilis TaxID=10195 RepID=A0A3M7QTR6_BRAPC|nr:hypothetical protein BpHYR1_035966 [Brachionus plicatilis]